MKKLLTYVVIFGGLYLLAVTGAALWAQLKRSAALDRLEREQPVVQRTVAWLKGREVRDTDISEACHSRVHPRSSLEIGFISTNDRALPLVRGGQARLPSYAVVSMFHPGAADGLELRQAQMVDAGRGGFLQRWLGFLRASPARWGELVRSATAGIPEVDQVRYYVVATPREVTPAAPMGEALAGGRVSLAVAVITPLGQRVCSGSTDAAVAVAADEPGVVGAFRRATVCGAMEALCNPGRVSLCDAVSPHCQATDDEGEGS